MTDLHDRILAAVEAGFQAQIALTQDLIALPSRRNAEHEAQRFMAATLTARGYQIDEVATDPDAIRDHPGFSPISEHASTAPNIVATHEPRQVAGRSLILNGHVDVVPEGPHEMWSRHPYDPWRQGDWLYGRGSGDMKAGLIACVAALDALRSLGLQPAARVHIQSVVEEECTGNGALACLVAGYTAEAAIIPEPEDECLVRANCGVLWFEVAIAGQPVHVREAGTGANAIDAASRVIASLRKIEARWNAEAPQHEHFRDMAHPINFNVGQIEGGDWASTVAAWCKMQCRIAIYPGDDPAVRAAEIEGHLRQDLADDPYLSSNPPQVNWNGFFARGYVLEEGSDAEDTLRRAHLTAASAPLQSLTTPGYLDGRVFVIYGDMPCLVYGPVSEAIHGFNERVSLSSVQRVTGAIALFIAEWCGLEAVDDDQP
ncbi:ArgE/DapE family deacylase (plasmid) [Paracoccus liaowanqingii]|uniref:ArgE/DapE family deacylase n=1 Tax=Paracoccus liaowanqingii TaxID=2560053 RepID=A0A4Y5SSR7_9RHOB|nr:ArgE/DapE family deacylase [Paracoccus liaowanqingii]QDA35846.1 ArgE/DapE family deacylase [Paracoccus liaowanqingii]